jgi:hypothetical protein
VTYPVTMPRLLSPDDRELWRRLQSLPVPVRELLSATFAVAEEEGIDTACWWLEQLHQALARHRPRVQ